MSTETETLLLCPCGGKPEFKDTGLHYRFRVQCSKCEAVSGNGTAFENNSWNARQWNILVGSTPKGKITV